MEQDEEPEFVGAKEAREGGSQELGLADKAGLMTGEGVVHAGGCLPICPPPTAGAAGSTPGFAPDLPGHGPCGGPQPGPEPEPQPEQRNAAA